MAYELRSVSAEGKEITYLLERKSVKNLNLRIRKDGGVFVSASKNVAVSEIDAFICKKAAFILDAINKFEKIAQAKPQPKQYISGETFLIQGRGLRLLVSQGIKDTITSDGVYIYLSLKDPTDDKKRARIVDKFLDTKCKSIFTEVIEDIYPIFNKYGVTMPTLRIRDMETRWGSCLYSKGIITLNKRLLAAPRNCIEYVAMHEFCHFIHPNHSKQFYMFLSTLMPDWKERKQYLDKIELN